MRGGARGRAGVTNMPLPRRASTYPLCLRSSTTRATVFVLMPRKPPARDAGQGLLTRDAAPVDGVLELLRQLPADRIGLCASTARFRATVMGV